MGTKIRNVILQQIHEPEGPFWQKVSPYRLGIFDSAKKDPIESIGIDRFSVVVTKWTILEYLKSILFAAKEVKNEECKQVLSSAPSNIGLVPT